VYALDLPGYGRSDRSDRDYTPRMMTDAVAAVVLLMCERQRVGSVDVLAVSLGCEFAARAQTEAPASIRRLALVSPTGMRGNQRRDGPRGATLGVPWLYRFFTRPRWSEGIFRNLTRPGVIRYFLRRTWGSRAIDEDLWRYAVITTRQPGARHAPLRFVSAYLFSRDIHAVFRQVSCPVWVSMATRGDFTDYRGRSVLQGRPNWQFHAVPGGALPYFEPASGFVPLLDHFWAAPAATDTLAALCSTGTDWALRTAPLGTGVVAATAQSSVQNAIRRFSSHLAFPSSSCTLQCAQRRQATCHLEPSAVTHVSAMALPQPKQVGEVRVGVNSDLGVESVE
jgi:pimeloyl-ACP methyl ester carboxylesterase